MRALADAVDTFHPDQIVISTLPPEESVWHRFDVVDRARAEYPNMPVTHVVARPAAGGIRAMTIIAGFSSSRQGSAPLNLAAQLARTTGEKVIAAAIIERALPAGIDPIEDEYQRHVATQATASLDRVVDRVRDNRDISVVVHQSTSIPRGLMELVDHHQRRPGGGRVVVVGSAGQGGPGQCDRTAGAHRGGAGGDRPPRLPVESPSRSSG